MSLSELIEALQSMQESLKDSNNKDPEVYFYTIKNEYLTPLHVEKNGKDVLIREL